MIRPHSLLNRTHQELVRIRSTWSRIDTLLLAIVTIFFILVYVFRLGELEYFRHTEADRTLIAWEMWQKGDYCIPHILGDRILTKPPLFYWLLAGSFDFWGAPTEFAARFPTVIVAGIYVAVQFMFLRYLTKNTYLATWGGLLLGSGLMFANLAPMAEIDLLYGLLSSLVFYAGFYFLLSPQYRSAMALALSMGLALLTKGPPIAVFFVVGGGCFFLWYFFSYRYPFSPRLIWDYICKSSVAGVAALAIVAAWFIPAVEVVGLQEFWSYLQVEVVERALGDRHNRGVFFYAGVMAFGFLPWTPLFLWELWNSLKRALEIKYTGAVEQSDDVRIELFRIYGAFCFLLGLFVLSMAEGKSSRYFFPLYGLGAALATLALLRLGSEVPSGFSSGFQWRVSQKVQGYLVDAAYFVMVVMLGVSVVSSVMLFLVQLAVRPDVLSVFTGDLLTKQTLFYWQVASLGCSALVGFCIYALRTPRWYNGLFVVVGLVLLTRFSYATIYTETRNQKKSVKQVVEEIDALLPTSVPLYSAKVYERWVGYYLQRKGREVVQDSSAGFHGARSDEHGYTYFLVSEEDDGVFLELLPLQEGYTVIQTFSLNGNRLHLIKVRWDNQNLTEPMAS